MKPSYKHYSALGIAFAIFVASIGGYVFMYFSVNSQAVNTAQAERDVNSAQDIAAKQQGTINILKATDADRAMLSSFVLSSDQTVSFIEQIEGVSKQSGATVTLVSISSDGTTLHAHINIQGQWTNVLRAMHIIENFPYSLSMDNVRLGVIGKGQWNEDFDIKVPVVTTPK